MARQRKLESTRPASGRPTTKPPVVHVRKASPERRFDSKFTMFVAFNGCLIVSVVLYVCFLHYLESWVIRPVDLPKVTVKSTLDIPERFWGSYRSSLYFGLKTRSPQPLVAGLMWFSHKLKNQNLPIRHWCNQWDRLQKYGWTRHDGVNFGVQQIVDEEFVIETSFVKRAGGRNGGDWTARISVNPKVPGAVLTAPLSLLFYFATDGHGHLWPNVDAKSHLGYIQGETSELGQFTATFLDRNPENVVHYSYLSTLAPGLESLKETVLHNLMIHRRKKGARDLYVTRGTVLSAEDRERKSPNFVLTQVTVMPPYELEVIFESGSFEDRPNRLSKKIYEQSLAEYIAKFDERFHMLFNLQSKGFSDEDNEAAKEVLSNLVGGIGYFYGSSLVQSSHNKEPVEYWKAPLYTAVPSRSFFPRGFLWDEGFHNLLLMRWDPEISKDILGHWLDLMNVDGWIPREQILGAEARSQVPAEFVVQRDTNANPPALLLTLEALLRQHDVLARHGDFLRRAFPRFLKLFQWLNSTQVGKLPGSYRWQGRDASSRTELNPKTLTSGLDDYPRASHPSEDERHVDLYSWLAFSSGVLAEAAHLLNHPSSGSLTATHHMLSNTALLDKLHLSSKTKRYCDYGLHTDKVRLVEQKPPPGQAPGAPPLPKVRLTMEAPQLQFVEHFGYVSLFPLLLRLLTPDHPALGKLLTDLRNPALLWTNYGLRSLSKDSPMYLQKNTDTDPPYWRGPVWININYLAVKALHHYSDLPGPFQDKAFQLYKELRSNIISNILKEYRQSNYIWENYDDITGKGRGSHPFTGWSALVVLLMGEVY